MKPSVVHISLILLYFLVALSVSQAQNNCDWNDDGYWEWDDCWDDGPNVGLIVGISIGVVVLITVTCVVACCCCVTCPLYNAMNRRKQNPVFVMQQQYPVQGQPGQGYPEGQPGYPQQQPGYPQGQAAYPQQVYSNYPVPPQGQTQPPPYNQSQAPGPGWKQNENP